MFLAQCYHVRVAKCPSNSLATTNCSSSGDSASEALLSELHRSDHVAWQSLQLKLTGLEDLASFSLGGHIFHTHIYIYMYIYIRIYIYVYLYCIFSWMVWCMFVLGRVVVGAMGCYELGFDQTLTIFDILWHFCWQCLKLRY